MFELLVQFLSSHFLFFALHFDNKTVFPKPLCSKDELECFERMEKGDKAAKDKLIEHNLRLVAHIIKKYYSASKDQDDLISIGTIGLIKAVSTFDYKKGCRFATYASRCIENQIVSFWLLKRCLTNHWKKIAENGRFSSKLMTIITFFTTCVTQAFSPLCISTTLN